MSKEIVTFTDEFTAYFCISITICKTKDTLAPTLIRDFRAQGKVWKSTLRTFMMEKKLLYESKNKKKQKVKTL